MGVVSDGLARRGNGVRWGEVHKLRVSEKSARFVKKETRKR